MIASSPSDIFTGDLGNGAPNAQNLSGGHLTQPWEVLYRYWCSKCVDGRPPALKDIDPIIDIPRLAANLLLIDVRPDGYWYRLIGSTNVERWGVDLTGKPLVDPRRSTRIRKLWTEIYDTVASDQKPRMIVSRMAAGALAKHIILATALADKNGKTDCLMVGVFYEGDFKKGSQIEDLMVYDMEL